MENKCIKCGFELKSEYYFCPRCGNSIVPVCTRCYTPLAYEGASFCVKCGQKIGEKKEEIEDSQKDIQISWDVISHPIEQKALQKVKELLEEFSRLYDLKKILPPEELKLDFDGEALDGENIALDEEVFFYLNDLFPQRLQIFIYKDLNKDWIFFDKGIFLNLSLWEKLDSSQKNWLLGYLLGHFGRNHHYYKRLREKLAQKEEDYSSWEKLEDFLFALKYLEQIGDFTADRLGIITEGDLNVAKKVIYLLKYGFPIPSVSQIIEKFKESPFWLKRIEELKSFLASDLFSLLKDKKQEKIRQQLESLEFSKVKIEKKLIISDTSFEENLEKEERKEVSSAQEEIIFVEEPSLPSSTEISLPDLEGNFIPKDNGEELDFNDNGLIEEKNEGEVLKVPLLPDLVETDNLGKKVEEIVEESELDLTPFDNNGKDEPRVEIEEEKVLVDNVSSFLDKQPMNFYILDYGNTRLQKWENSQYQGSFIVDQIKYFSTGVLYGERGFWAADFKNHQIIFYNKKGEVKKRFGEKGDKAGQYNFPLAVIQWQESLFICDSWNNRIVQVDLNGNFLKVFKEYAGLEFSYPCAIWTDGEEIIFIDSGNKRLISFKEGKKLNLYFEISEVDSPVGIEKKDNNIFISDNGNHTIWRYDSEGNLIAQIGKYGNGPGELDTPEGIACSEGKLLVANSWNHRLEVFDLEGNFLYHLGEYGIGDGKFNNPTDVVIFTERKAGDDDV